MGGLKVKCSKLSLIAIRQLTIIMVHQVITMFHVKYYRLWVAFNIYAIPITVRFNFGVLGRIL
jgi:hypothetical protein